MALRSVISLSQLGGMGCAALLSLVVVSSTAAQGVPPSPLESLVQEPLPTQLDIQPEALDQLAARVEAAGGDALAEAAVLEARGFLERSGQVKARIAELGRVREAAPALIEATRRRLMIDLGDPLEELPNGISLDYLVEEVARVEAELAAARAGLAEQQRELNRLSERRLVLPKGLADARVAFEEAKKPLALRADLGDDSLLQQAERLRSAARYNARELDVLLSQAELDSYDLRRELASVVRDFHSRQADFYERKLEPLQAALGSQRNAEAVRAVDSARDEQEAWASLHPALSAIAERNLALAEARTGPLGLATRIESAERESARIADRLQSLRASFDSVTEKTQAVGFTDTIGLLLRKQRADLPDVERLKAGVREREGLISNQQLELFELEEAREGLYDIETRVREIARQRVEDGQSDHLAQVARTLLVSQRELLEASISDQEAYFSALVGLDASARELIRSTTNYRNFIDEHVLWIRSTSFVAIFDAKAHVAAALWLVDPENLSQAASTFVGVGWTRPLSAFALLTFLLLLVVYRGRLAKFSQDVSATRGKDHGGPIAGAFVALLAAAGAAVAWPSVLWGIAWFLATGADSNDDYARALSAGLHTTASLYFTLEFIRQFTAKGGLARTFFGWPGKALEAGRLALSGAMVPALPLLFVASVLDVHPVESWSAALGRSCFVAALLVFAVALHRGLAADAPLTLAAARRAAAPWSRLLAAHAGKITPFLAMALALGSLFGFYFTARDLTGRIHETIRLMAFVAFASGTALRWLALARGRLARIAAEGRRAAQKDGDSPLPVGEAGVIVEEELDVSTVGDQTRQLLRSGLGVALLFGLWVVWSDVMPAFRVLDNVEVWSAQGDVVVNPGIPDLSHLGAVQSDASVVSGDDVSVTLADILAAIVVLVLTVVSTRNLPGFLELAVLPQSGLAPGVRYAVTSIVRYVVATVGAVLTFGALGISWSNVQWLVAAMTVGLGFGLQEIFANFVSGLIILFERPIRVGDTVTLGDITGTITRIRIRATTLLDWDRKELVVPNKEFITGQLVNWTLSDPIVRVKIVVGIAYGSDTELAEALLYEAAASCENVLAEPKPSVLFDEFGDNSLTFTLRCFVNGLDVFWQSQHALHMLIDKKFREAGIEIAFPQRDLHLRTVSESASETIKGLERLGPSRGRTSP